LTRTAERVGPQSLLDLWHPTGAPLRRLAVGRNGRIQPTSDSLVDVDIAVVAPGAEEVSRRWLEHAIYNVSGRLAPDAVLWLILPVRWRRHAERLLNRAGLVLVGTALTLPQWPETTHLIPLSPAALHDAVRRDLELPPAVAGVLVALAHVRPARWLVRRRARGCALIAAPRASVQPFRWLSEVDGVPLGTATAALGPRRDSRVAVMRRLPEQGGRPDLIVKVALDAGGEDRLAREREALEILAPDARRAGAAVPRLCRTEAPWLLVTAALAGRPASSVLAGKPAELEDIFGGLAAWLGSWAEVTASTIPAERKLLVRLLSARAESVAQSGLPVAEYVEALTALTERIESESLILTAAHNDLTMSNVLVRRGGCGVVDWESAVAASPPLVDLWYALADAVARACRVTHAKAVEALVRGRAPAPSALAGLPAHHARALGMSAEQAMLSFHACWLHHAANERARGVAHGPFLAVVRNVVEKRLLWPHDGGYTSK
jgi:hypothetical protein